MSTPTQSSILSGSHSNPNSPFSTSNTSTAAAAKIKIPLICGGHSRPVPEVAYSNQFKEGFYMISACLDGKAMLRHGESGDWIGSFLGHKGAVWSAQLNSPATQAATASADYSVKLWNAITGEEQHTFNHDRIVKTVAFSPDDKKLLSGGQAKVVKIFDLQKLDAEPLKIEGFSQPIKTAVWTANGFIVVAVQDEPLLNVYDSRTLSVVKSISTKYPVLSIEVSRDGKYITTAGGKEVLFWDAATFELRKSLVTSIDSNSAALHPDGSTFAVGCLDHWVRVYEFSSLRETEVMKGHHGPVHCVRYAPDGNTFASSSEDGTIRLWQSGEIKPYGLWQDSSKTDKDSHETKS